MSSDSRIFLIKRNDTLPSLSIKVKSRNCINAEIAFNLSGVTATTFTMMDENGSMKISSASAQTTSISGGTVQYNWSSTDTDTSGRYKGEFELRFSDGNKLSIPTLGAIDIKILDDLNNS